MNIRQLNERGFAAIPLSGGRIGIVTGSRVLSVNPDAKLLDPFASELAIRAARDAAAEWLAVGLALGAEIPPTKAEPDLPAAPFVRETIAESPLRDADVKVPEPLMPEVDMGKAGRKVIGMDDTAPFLDAVTGLASGKHERIEGWDE